MKGSQLPDEVSDVAGLVWYSSIQLISAVTKTGN